MLGVLVNTVAVVVGSLIGLLFKKGIPQKLTDAVMLGIGLCTLYIGVDGALEGENTLILIGSIAIGAIVGTALDLDGWLNKLGQAVGRRGGGGDGGVSVAAGFVTASMLFCIGAMTFVGCLEAGLTGNNRLLLTKSLLDFISSIVLSVSLGAGVLFSAAFVLVFQGVIVLAAQWLSPILTASAIAEITCAGSVIIIALGLNLIGVTKVKVANYLPAIVAAPLLSWLAPLISSLFGKM